MKLLAENNNKIIYYNNMTTFSSSESLNDSCRYEFVCVDVGVNVSNRNRKKVHLLIIKREVNCDKMLKIL